jgi:hypothetical protein
MSNIISRFLSNFTNADPSSLRDLMSSVVDASGGATSVSTISYMYIGNFLLQFTFGPYVSNSNTVTVTLPVNFDTFYGVLAITASNSDFPIVFNIICDSVSSNFKLTNYERKTYFIAFGTSY